MLIKPIIATSTDSISSLPEKSQNRSPSSYPYSGEDEKRDYIENYGRLLILSLVSKEISNAFNKINHDNFVCRRKHWCLCSCSYAKLIRGLDMNMNIDRIEELREVL